MGRLIRVGTMQDGWRKARAKRDEGMSRVETKAGPEWAALAEQQIVQFAHTHDLFMAEDVVEASADNIPQPHDRRAWGPVFARVAKQGVIAAAGYAPAKTSNTSPKVQWRSLVRQ